MLDGEPFTVPSRLRRLGVLALAAGLLVPVGALADASGHPPGPQPPTGFWIAGDLHVHTIYGHDTCIDPQTAWDYKKADLNARRSCEDFYTVGFSPARRLDEAADRGLGFVALTDHNNVMNQTDPQVLAWRQEHPDFAVLPGYENSQPGHVQMLGARSCYGNSGAIPGALVECADLVTDKTATGETALADGLRADGGVFQVNHPSDMKWPGTYHLSVVPDTMEVWNIGPWAFQQPFPSSNDNDYSLTYYDRFLRQGAEIAATGGSDSHWVTTDAAQGIGEPTTWVFVRKPTVQAVLEGLRAHHTFVSALPPVASGPRLFLEADSNGDGVYEAIAGSETSTHATFRIRTENAVPGSILRIVTDTGSFDTTLGGGSAYVFRPGVGNAPEAHTFVRAELLVPDEQDARSTTCDPTIVGTQTTLCRNKLAMEALTTPVFIR